MIISEPRPHRLSFSFRPKPRMLSEDDVMKLLIGYQDRVVQGLRRKSAVALDHFQADAYDQAAAIVLSTPFAPETE